MKKNYIGLANSCHDSAIAIINSHGEVVFAEATERYLQNKRAVNIAPDTFLRIQHLIETYCDADAELVLAYTWSDETERLLGQQLADTNRQIDSLDSFYTVTPDFIRRNISFTRFIIQSQLNAVNQRGRTIEYAITQIEGRNNCKYSNRSYEHHLSHAATACFSSPFDDAVCAIIDGYGEGRAYSCYAYNQGRLEEIPLPSCDNQASLGAFYIILCELCGFGQITGEEWKVMGLAAYGSENQEILSLLRNMIKVEGLNIVFCNNLRMLRLLKKLNALRRTPSQPVIKAADIAWAGQKVFSEIMLTLLNNLYALGISDRLVLGGGCALNSSTNGQILANTGFNKLHVYSAPADDGNAIGAALLAFYEDHPQAFPATQPLTAFLGSAICSDALQRLSKFSGFSRLNSCSDPARRAAQLLAEGKIIGWIQGAAEFGPRALGNRSILADPRLPDIKQKINDRIKFREWYRPFAPSILHEYGETYFENYQESPYMERTLKFRSDVIDQVPGVVHIDGTGRLQTVKPEWNPRFHQLITEFHALTGIPLVLNTSLNIMGKPIVHSLEDALALFSTTGLDALFINDVLIEK